MPMLFRFENAQTIFSPQFIKALGGICSRFAFRNANLLPSALATDSLTSTFSLYVFLIFLFVFLCLLSCLLLLHQVNVQRRFAKQIFLYLFISNVARISPLCVLCVAFESVIDQIQPELLNMHNQSISSCAHTDFMFCFS